MQAWCPFSLYCQVLCTQTAESQASCVSVVQPLPRNLSALSSTLKPEMACADACTGTAIKARPFCQSSGTQNVNGTVKCACSTDAHASMTAGLQVSSRCADARIFVAQARQRAAPGSDAPRRRRPVSSQPRCRQTPWVATPCGATHRTIRGNPGERKDEEALCESVRGSDALILACSQLAYLLLVRPAGSQQAITHGCCSAQTTGDAVGSAVLTLFNLQVHEVEAVELGGRLRPAAAHGL
jgi:hypothetical protein